MIEGIREGDATASPIPEHTLAHATLVSRDATVLAGAAWFNACFDQLHSDIVIQWMLHDGDPVTPGRVLCRLLVRARAMRSAERTALNFLQLLSSTASVTARYVAQLEGTATMLMLGLEVENLDSRAQREIS